MQLSMGKFMVGAGGALLGMKVTRDPAATLLLLAAAGFMIGRAIEQRCPLCRALLRVVIVSAPSVWVRVGTVKAPNTSNFLLAAAGLGDVESRLHPHERFHLHAESLLEA
jgi:hypothetical protein